MPEARELGRTDALVAGLLALGGIGLGIFLRLGGGRGGAPVVHDEHAYLLQAQMLARGHLSMPSPPLPEFFEAMHVLVVPRYAAKYFPGHAALLAPFLLLGAPWLLSALQLGACGALLFLAARLSRVQRLAALLAPALLVCSEEMLALFGSWFSQTTSLLCVCGALAAAAALAARPGPARAALLATCAGWAVLTRPLTGAALCVASATLLVVLLRRGLQRRALAAFALPLLAAAALGLSVDREVTGRWTQTPWSLYATQYSPGDGLGTGPLAAQPPLRGLPPHLRPVGDAFLASRRAYSPGKAASEVAPRLRIIAAGLPGPALLLLGAAAFASGPALWFGAGFALLDFATLLDFHWVRGQYLVELQPPLFLLAAAGLGVLLGLLARLQGPAARAMLGSTLALGALWVAVAGGDTLAERARYLASASGRPGCPTCQAALAAAAAQRGLVFLRYPPEWDANTDLTFNEADLARAPLVRALDLGPRNAELMRLFPERPAFLLDAGTGALERLR